MLSFSNSHAATALIPRGRTHLVQVCCSYNVLSNGRNLSSLLGTEIPIRLKPPPFPWALLPVNSGNCLAQEKLSLCPHSLQQTAKACTCAAATNCWGVFFWTFSPLLITLGYCIPFFHSGSTHFLNCCRASLIQLQGKSINFRKWGGKKRPQKRKQWKWEQHPSRDYVFPDSGMCCFDLLLDCLWRQGGHKDGGSLASILFLLFLQRKRWQISLFVINFR